MRRTKRPASKKRRFPHTRFYRPRLELLETRDLPSSFGIWGGEEEWQHVAEEEPNDTIDTSVFLGDLNDTPAILLTGEIEERAGGGDVDWYSFTLWLPTQVTAFAVTKETDTDFLPVLSLYNSDPFNWDDPFTPLGNRLLVQGEGEIQYRLAPGTYFLAVSGPGNYFFSPYLAESGYQAGVGSYTLGVAAVPLELDWEDGPIVLETSPAPDAQLDRSPFVLRVGFSGELDPSTLFIDDTIRLSYFDTEFSEEGEWADAWLLSGAFFSWTTSELLLTLSAPLAPGRYQLFLAGNADEHFSVIRDYFDRPLGATSANPAGEDFYLYFEVVGIEGRVGVDTPDDTIETAHYLGDLAEIGFIQIQGAIGDDPTDFFPFNPADVDIYRFSIIGEGRYSFISEVFGFRLGHPLDPALSLFRITEDGYEFLAANDNSLNPTQTDQGLMLLFYEPVLYHALTAGEYFLVVSGGGNVPDPQSGMGPGEFGVFDPEQSHSGWLGFTIGEYVLNIQVRADDTPPQVVAITPSEGETFAGAPTHVTVQFTEPVNLRELAYLGYSTTGESIIHGVHIESEGRRYYPRFVMDEMDLASARFLMFENLPDGVHSLRLSGITDLAGNPLVGNEPGGDYVITFTVTDSTGRIDGGPLFIEDDGGFDSPAQPRELGVIFPQDIIDTVIITRDGLMDAFTDGTATYFQFELLGPQWLMYGITSDGLTGDVHIHIEGETLSDSRLAPNGQLQRVYFLTPGVYTIGLDWLGAEITGPALIQIIMSSNVLPENPSPLTIGPAPAIRIRLAGMTPTDPAPDLDPGPPGGAESGLQLPPGSGGSLAGLPLVFTGTDGTSLSSSVYRDITQLPPSLGYALGVLLSPGAGPVGSVAPSGQGNDQPVLDLTLRGDGGILLTDGLLRLGDSTPPSAIGFEQNTDEENPDAPFPQAGEVHESNRMYELAIDWYFTLKAWVQRFMQTPPEGDPEGDDDPLMLTPDDVAPWGEPQQPEVLGNDIIPPGDLVPTFVPLIAPIGAGASATGGAAWLAAFTLWLRATRERQRPVEASR